MSNKIDIAGRKYHRLTPIESTNIKGIRSWKCLCDCGKSVIVPTNRITSGNTKSCGCLKLDTLKSRSTAHGFGGRGKNRTKIYRIWSNINTRCNNRNRKGWKHYGGKGVKNLWSSFDEFLSDMLESYNEHVSMFGEKNTTIERINVDGHYSKENCKWATIGEQAKNKSTSRIILYDGRYLSPKEISKILGLTYLEAYNKFFRKQRYRSFGLR